MDKYEKHVVPFMMRTYRYNTVGEIVQAEDDAFKYIISENDFRENDIVAVECLLDKAISLGLLEKIGKQNEKHYYILTLKGIEIINR
jgi:hypothetical protein